MKKIALFLFILLLFISEMQADEFDLEFIQKQGKDISSKIYVNPTDIFLSEKQIFLQTDHGLVEIFSLKMDDQGIFTQLNTAHPEKWYCSRCREDVHNSWYCPYCGYSPNGSQNPDPREDW